MTLTELYIRWRHSKGYGVHSPYAYRFITDVLKPGDYGFYAYDQLEILNKNFKTQRSSFYKEAKFLIRLCVFLDTKRIITCKTKYPEAQIVAKALKKVYYCCESSVPSFKEGDTLILTPNGSIDTEVIKKALEHKVPVYAVNPSAEERKLLETPLSHGVLFNAPSKLLLIPRQKMEYVAYSINL